MKRIFYYQINSLLWCLMLILIMTASSDAQIVTNGSFENSVPAVVDTYAVDGWYIEVDDAISPAPEFSVVNDTAQQGSHSLRVVVNAIGTDPWEIQLVADSLPVQTGETYRYSVWAKSSASSQVYFTIGNYAFRNTGPFVLLLLMSQQSGSSIQYSLRLQMLRRSSGHRFILAFAPNVGDTIWIDNMRISNVEDALKPIVIEAESGTIGADFAVLQDGDTNYVSTQVQNTAFNPGSLRRVSHL